MFKNIWKKNLFFLIPTVTIDSDEQGIQLYYVNTLYESLLPNYNISKLKKAIKNIYRGEELLGIPRISDQVKNPDGTDI